jgi:anaerobic magnesium-protoporphyrin IX monomethyl ester cyclase
VLSQEQVSRLKVMFVEPPKKFWFLMGEYLPPPLGILQLASYLEREIQDAQIQVVDCQAESLDWTGLEQRIRAFDPDIVASSGLATCNAYTVARTLATAKKVKPEILTVAGGQHFTATAKQSLKEYAEIDVIVRGEGEQTLAELAQSISDGRPLSEVKGISYRSDGEILETPPRPLIDNLDDLPFPGYHFVKDFIHKYHFTMMTGQEIVYLIIEGSRGCQHRCIFCTQWRHWGGRHRFKSAKRIADEIEFCYRKFNGRFIWLTDDNFTLGERASDLCDEILRRKLDDEITWFVQTRCDDVLKHRNLLPKLRRAGCRWMLLGAESHSKTILKKFNKSIDPEQTKEAVKLLKTNGIFAHAMFILGERDDSRESIAALRKFADEVDPDLAIFTILTPFPGSDIHRIAVENGWIKDLNFSNYDMVHPVMPTETLSIKELSYELYKCYRSFYGSWKRCLQGIFSSNKLKRRVYRYMMSRAILSQLRGV